MISNDERREVAERLREATKQDEWLDVAVSNAIFGAMGEVRRPIADTLADLIDPTCHNTLPQNWGTFECSECGAQFEVSYVFMTASGTDDSEPVTPRFCPNCGARVVSE